MSECLWNLASLRGQVQVASGIRLGRANKPSRLLAQARRRAYKDPAPEHLALVCPDSDFTVPRPHAGRLAHRRGTATDPHVIHETVVLRKCVCVCVCEWVGWWVGGGWVDVGEWMR